MAGLDKPTYGSPCNGCGYCCQNELCPLGRALFRRVSGPCPALEPVGDSFVCGLVAHPEIYAPVRSAVVGRDRLSTSALALIGAGAGCDARYPHEPKDPDFVAHMRAVATSDAKKTVRAIAAWGF